MLLANLDSVRKEFFFVVRILTFLYRYNQEILNFIHVLRYTHRRISGRWPQVALQKWP